MRKWLKSLLSSEGDASSKRASAILSLLVCISFAYIATFTEYKCGQSSYPFLATARVSM